MDEDEIHAACNDKIRALEALAARLENERDNAIYEAERENAA